MFRIFLVFTLSLSFAGLSHAKEQFGDLLNCQNTIEMEGHRGQTFLSFMEKTVKPALDEYATRGYMLADADEVISALSAVDKKVYNKAIRGGDGEAGLRHLIAQLKDQAVSLYTLPALISNVDRESDEYKYDRFGLSTYLGLASCAGAIVKFYDDNYAYNIHYGTGKVAKDSRTGRSFGAGPGRMANDASDKAYLTDLEEYVTNDTANIEEFHKTILQALSNTDTRNYKNVTERGQTVITDFLAVYIAEQDRNLMDGKISLHWDAALLEVTLLSGFHAGQDEIKLYYKDPKTSETSFTNKVYNQNPACEANSTQELKSRKAGLKDYWQFSKNPNPEHCRRSGINITKSDFRRLGKAITEYEERNNPELVANVRRHLTGVSNKGNLYQELSMFFINSDTDKSLTSGRKYLNLTKDYVNFLNQVHIDAQAITEEIESE